MRPLRNCARAPADGATRSCGSDMSAAVFRIPIDLLVVSAMRASVPRANTASAAMTKKGGYLLACVRGAVIAFDKSL